MGEMSPKPRHVGIVGAGLAGLRCADILLQHGFRVTILEGRDRIGGRMCQEQLANGALVDMGPNWIHGTDNNPMVGMAAKTGTVTKQFEHEGTCFDEDGTMLSRSEAEECASLLWSIFEEAFKYSNEHTAELDPQKSLLDFCRDKMEDAIPDTTENWRRKRYSVLQMAELWGQFVGTEVKTQSLKFLWLEECIEGENLFCAGTYQKILELIAQPVMEAGVVQYATRITKLRSREHASDMVTTSDSAGVTRHFDDVVVTAPLGWLKRNECAFDPPLAPRLSSAIRSIGYGCLEKVYISFSTAFWKKSNNHAVHGFCQWLAPKYATRTNPEQWMIEAVEMANFDDSVAHPTLLFYLCGEQSRYLVKEVAKLVSRKEKDDFLYNFFQPYFSLIPGYVADSSDCQTTGTLSTSWLLDDLAGNGSYCNFQTGLEAGDEDIRTMRHGLPERGLWFAGEHTAPFVALGTATGAYWSGEAVGKRIVEAYAQEVG